MSIHKVYMSLLIMFIKFFVIQFLTMVFNFACVNFARIFIREALISRFFTSAKIAN